MLSARSLRKASVPPSLLSDPSPGCLQPTRLAVHVNGDGGSCSAYFASGCRVFKIEISMEEEVLSKGKESLLIPISAQVISSSVVNRCPHRSEIQSVVLAEGEGDSCLILGTVDSYGHLIVSRLDTVAEDIDRASYSVPPRDSGVGEGSWAGLCFSPTHQSTVAVARELCKSIDIYDQDIHIRSLHTLWYPSSVRFAQCFPQGSESSSILAITEGPQLSIWDFRMHNNGGCVQRVSGPIGGILYSVCTSPSGLIAVGGTDRAVTVYDPRRWSALSRWVGCSKYEIGLPSSDVTFCSGLLVFRFRQWTNPLYTSKVLIMRLLVDAGEKVSAHSHFEVIRTGWAFQSVRIRMWLLGGVSLEVSSLLMLGRIFSR